MSRGRGGRGTNRSGNFGGGSMNNFAGNSFVGGFVDSSFAGDFARFNNGAFNDGFGGYNDGNPYHGSEWEKRTRAARERPSRTLFVRNIAYDISEEDLRQEFGKHGEIKKVFNLIDKRGMAFITFYDLRHADKAKRELQDTELGGRKIDVHYSLPKEDSNNPKDEDDKNKGTLFVTVRDATEEIDNVALKKLFEQWGAIKEVRDCTGNPNQKFVECWDLRDSAKIVQEKQEFPFAGGRLDIKYAYHSTPRDKRPMQDIARAGPIRSSFGQRQARGGFNQIDANFNRGGFGSPTMGFGNFTNPQANVVTQIAALLAAQQNSPNSSAPGFQVSPQPNSASAATVQQLAYLLSLQQQLNNSQNQINQRTNNNPSNGNGGNPSNTGNYQRSTSGLKGGNNGGNFGPY